MQLSTLLINWNEELPLSCVQNQASGYVLSWVYPPVLQAMAEAGDRVRMQSQVHTLFFLLCLPVGYIPISKKGQKHVFFSRKHRDRKKGCPLTTYTCLKTSNCSSYLQNKTQSHFSVIQTLWGMNLFLLFLLWQQVLPASLVVISPWTYLDSFFLWVTLSICPNCNVFCLLGILQLFHFLGLNVSPNSSTKLPQTTVSISPLNFHSTWSLAFQLKSQTLFLVRMIKIQSSLL
jgi:hypothetical protein